MKQRVRRKPVSEINVVPYIDVMLVLLIIFMVTAPMLVQGVDINLPEVSSEPLSIDEQNNYLTIALTQGGQALIERGNEPPETVDDPSIVRYVSGVLASNPKLQILLRADQEVRYGRVMRVMSALQSSGIRSVGLVTEVPSE